jgi:hypothetical protein
MSGKLLMPHHSLSEASMGRGSREAPELLLRGEGIGLSSPADR